MGRVLRKLLRALCKGEDACCSWGMEKMCAVASFAVMSLLDTRNNIADLKVSFCVFSLSITLLDR